MQPFEEGVAVSDSEPWEHGFVDLEEVRLHYVSQGEGPLVVLLHGFPEFWYSWRHQIPALAESFKVVACDMRGYNLSDKPARVSDYTRSHLTADVAQLIEAMGYSKAHVVGHDWGGVVAWSFAMDQPSRLDRLVVMNAPHPADFLKKLASNPRQLLMSLYVFFFQLPTVPEFVLSAADYFVLKRSFSDWAIDKSAFSREDLDRLAGAAAVPGALRSGLNYYRAAFRDFSQVARMRREPRGVASDTLLIWAEDDAALGKELTYGLDSYCDRSLEIRYIPNCSHWVQQEQPLLVNEMLRVFLHGG